MPGGGLTAIGMAGLVTSYSGLAHTFIDGMHALTGLLFFIGLIFLSAGILDGEYQHQIEQKLQFWLLYP